MAPKKWYAVRKGHSTGIFNTWDECQAATVGFSGAEYKSFKLEQDARAWLAGSNAGAAPAAAAGAPAAAYAPTNNSRRSSAQSTAAGAAAGGKVYAVARGRQAGIFDSWEQTKAVVEGYTNPVFRSFRTRQEAADFLAAHSSSSSGGGGGGGGSGGGSRGYGTVRGTDDNAGAAAKRQRGASYQAPPPPPAFNSQQQQQQGGQAPPAVQLSQHPLVTITFDGGSRNNPGRAGYGYAVFERQHNDRVRMGCRPLPYGSTNNEAEYSGLIAGMRYSLEKLGARHIVARGDSQLVVRQMTGQYKVNGERLLPLHREAKLLEQRCESFQIEHIYREENSLADLLSNLAMDSDAAVDQLLLAWQRGASRGELAALLAAGAQVDGDINQVNKLREAPCFMLAVAQLLASLWDNMPVEEVTANLAARGWDEATGGPPVEPLPLPLGTNSPAAAATEGAGAGTSGVVAAAVAAMQGGARQSRGQQHGVVRSGRGMQAVPVAPVTLGQDWAREVGRQEALMQQQQQQQQQQRGVANAGGGATVGTLPAQQRTSAAAASVPRLLVDRPVVDAAAASLAAAPFHRADESVLLQLQRYRQRRAWPYSSGGGGAAAAAAAASMTCIAGGSASSSSSRMHLLHLQLQPLQQHQQHSVFGRVLQHNGNMLLSRGSSSGGSIRARAGLAITAAAAAAVRLSRREAAGYNSSNDSSRRQRGMRGLAV